MTIVAFLEKGYFGRCRECGGDMDRPRPDAVICTRCLPRVQRRNEQRGWQLRRARGTGEYAPSVLPSFWAQPDRMKG